MNPLVQEVEEISSEIFIPETGPDPFFNVWIRPLVAAYGGTSDENRVLVENSIGSLQAVFGRIPGNPDFEEVVLAVHGNRYRLITNQEVVVAYEDAAGRLESVSGENDVDLSTPRITNALGDGGARMIRTYMYENAAHNLLPGTPVCFEARLLNSYNGTYKTGVVAGGRLDDTRFGQIHLVWSDSTVNAFGKHTSGIHVPTVIGSIDRAYRTFVNEVQDKADLINYPFAVSNMAHHLHSTPLANETATNNMTARFNRYANVYGATEMSMYLALCEWATSGDDLRPSASNNAAVVRYNRERTVRKVMRTLRTMRRPA
jgi:hypothetical protein